MKKNTSLNFDALTRIVSIQLSSVQFHALDSQTKHFRQTSA